jgi:hypothetical protein
VSALACAVVAVGCWQEPIGSPAIELEPATETVTVVIDPGEGQAKTYADITLSENMTVVDVLEKLKPRGLSFESRGNGATAFVESINGIKNAGSGKNWIYYVNDEKSTVGAGVYILKPDDVILWKYTDKIE